MTRSTLAQALAEGFQRHGVRRIFGVPGGGSALPIIDASKALGIEFILARSESAASIMAAVTGELSGMPGVVLACAGPGAASLTNGAAYAKLEQAPLLLLTDGPASSLHQRYDQNALFAPITKHQGRLTPEYGITDVEEALTLACQAPMGPVQMNINATGAVTLATGRVGARRSDDPPPPAETVAAAAALIERSRKPLLLVGLEARYGAAPDWALRLAEALDCPVLSTYKAKGVVPDRHPRMVGMFTGAASEFQAIEAADLILTFGVDPVEFIAGPWTHDAPVVEIRTADLPRILNQPALRLIGPICATAEALLAEDTGNSDWTGDVIDDLNRTITERVAISSNAHTAHSVTRAIVEAAPGRIRASVDAGAHMISAMSLIDADLPFGALKSNGLSTMGYALPAAIASALHDPETPAVAITGDGGLMMCLAELTTAAEHGCGVITVVLNDSALSLIDVKQQFQKLDRAGVSFAPVDYAAIARAMGIAAWQVGPGDNMIEAMRAAYAHGGPALIDVTIDASVYKEQVAALRG